MLGDLTVIELGDFVSAPYCGKLLVDLGADVIKVESPGYGDSARRYGPFSSDIPDPEGSGLFLYLNSNKHSVTLDIETAIGASVFKDMVRFADVVLESMPIGFLEERGLSFDSLSAINPNLVMVSITPFGQTGPYRYYKSCDLVTSHMSGLAYSTPDIKSRDDPPVKPSMHYSDLTAGLTGSVAMLSAILTMSRGGGAQHLDISEQESMLALMRFAFDEYTASGDVPDRFGPAAVAFGPHGNFRCKDGYINLTCLTDQQWRYFKEAIGNPEWADSEVFDTSVGRGAYRDAMEPLVEEWTVKWTKEEIYRHMQAYHFPAFPVNTIEEFVASDHFNARGFLVDMVHPAVPTFRVPRPPYIFADITGKAESAAPFLGEHTEQIFCDRLGYTRKQLAELRQEGTV